MGLEEARLLSEQKRVAQDLDRKVAQRTEELAAANTKLHEEILKEQSLAVENLKAYEEIAALKARLGDRKHLPAGRDPHSSTISTRSLATVRNCSNCSTGSNPPPRPTRTY